MDRDILDKLILLQATKHPMPMPSSSGPERKAFFEVLEKEIPAFLWYLTHQWRIPDWLLNGEFSQRYGMDSYKHPEVLRTVSELAPEFHLLNLIDEAKFTRPDTTPEENWKPKLLRLSARELERQLRAHFNDQRWMVDRVLKGPNSCQTLLGRLAGKCPDRIKKARTHGERLWDIIPPSNPPEHLPI
jgi:hypothetical protein